jgi:molybdopterin-containing oxidoreductase family iron-sulfur binding subunit
MAEKTGFNRRDFLKIVGAGAGLVAAGCSKELPERFIPYVVQPDEIVPGVATWYAGFCNECSAGCGTMARVREGRVTKVEGLPAHPVNQGGLCAVGQSTVQALYDPDRIREPLKRDVGGSFTPVSWKDAVDAVAQTIADAKGGNDGIVFVTKRLSGSEAALLAEFGKGVKNFEHIEYELSDRDATNIALDKLFGQSLEISYDFGEADVVVGVGADYLETWGSPVKNARGWAARRKPENGAMSKVFHLEPRLSLTAGNADRWIMNAPGSELALLLLLSHEISQKPRKIGVTDSVFDLLGRLTKGLDTKALAKASGVAAKDIKHIADELYLAKKSLVVAGGASTSGVNAVEIQQLAILLNIALGNFSAAKPTVSLYASSRKAKSGYAELVKLCADLVAKKRKLSLLAVYGPNPAYSLPSAVKFKGALSQVANFVSFSGHIDETTTLANLVLPLSHQLECWGDGESVTGALSLNQPAMQPIYKTQCFGDSMLAIMASDKVKLAPQGIESFENYIKARWEPAIKAHSAQAKDWLACVERGGLFIEQSWMRPDSMRVSGVGLTPEGLLAKATASIPASGTTVLMAYPSVTSHDGSSANRPWMQELPNPITSAVWGSWVEMGSDVAKNIGVSTGDMVQVTTDGGFIEAPAYVSKFVHPGVVAVPIGQGHEVYGRYAAAVGTNALSVLTSSSESVVTPLTGTVVKLRRSLSEETLVLLQGSNSQHKRGIGRVVSLEDFKKKGNGGHHGDDHRNGGDHGHGSMVADAYVGHGNKAEKLAAFGFKEPHHHDPLALGPREEPKMMYKQSEHPVYKWGMSIDLASCTGCSACIVACFAENNIPAVGKTVCDEGREMHWLRVERFLDGPFDENNAGQPVEGFIPMMCQQCGNAPCEPVCPVYATYHTEDGLNSMVYNRCVGTRYCLNNCSYKVRRFNWYKWDWPEPSNWQLNPDVTVREVGVMEKCTFCVQRVREGQNNAKDEGRLVADGEVQPACASSCPTKAITFGNLKDHSSEVAKKHNSSRSYKVLDVELNTQPAIAYLARVRNEEGSA